MAAMTPAHHTLLLLAVTCTLIGQVLTQDATVFFRIPEQEQIRTYIGSVALKSNLFTEFSNERFELLQFQILVPGNKYYGMYDIETDTGLLWTNQVVDREDYLDCVQTCEMDFNVAVYEKGVFEPINIIKVIVDVEDINDNKPYFVPSTEELVISESVSIGSELLRRSAIDLDQGPGNSVKTYTMFPVTETFDIETVYNDGIEFVVKLKKHLDYESVGFYQVIILAKDGGTPAETGTLSVDIRVTDYNDNAPEFAQDLYELNVEENAPVNSTILVLYASDKDEDENADITYKFSGRVPDKISNLFSVNESSGELKIAGQIDYEADKQFEFSVHAVDHGNPAKTSTTYVMINVQDINDNYPQIYLNQPPGGTVLSELADIDSFVTHVEITDLDDGINGLVSCIVLDDHFRLEKLEIENNFQVVLNRSLDHDIQSSHNVSIVCQDSGDSPKQSFASFVVHVEDRNDNSPNFTKEIYSVTVVENNARGAFIVGVSATDKDSGPFGQVSYSLHSSTEGLFVINSLTGIITANASLDRETDGDQRIFRVFAHDGGDPALTSTGTVVVNILDLNDNPPIFTKTPLFLNVTENLPKDTIVGNISVHDPDKETNGTFNLTFPSSPNVTDYFRFTSAGLILTNKQLDREMTGIHTFNVSATDMGGLSSFVQVVIDVQDDNDNQPEILYPNDNIQFLPFTAQPGTLVAQVLAEDRDAGENSLLNFAVIQNNATFPFILNKYSGKLTLNGTISSNDIGKSMHFLVKVTDSGSPPLQTLTSVNVQVTDDSPIIEASTATAQSNLYIMIAIVAVTLVLSAIMVAVILKICWVGRRKGSSRSSSNVILESGEVNPKLLPSSLSSSAASTSSTDTNANEKIKVADLYPPSDGSEDGFHQNKTYPPSEDGFQQKDMYPPSEDGFQQKDMYPTIEDGFQQKGTCLQPEETGSMMDTTLSSSVDKHEDRLYMEKVKELSYEMQKRSEETSSDNSAEMGTRDSGQGGSEVDLNSLSELPILDIPDVGSYSEEPTSPSHQTYLTEDFSDSNQDSCVHDNNLYSISNSSIHSNQSATEKTLGSFQLAPTRTAERKELSKLKRGQKRVMFSDDLENSHSSGRSSTMSTLSYSDLVPNTGITRQLHRLYSNEPNKHSDTKVRNSVPAHRSVDNLIVDSIHGNKFVRFPSYHNRYRTAGQMPETQNSDKQSGLGPWQNGTQTYGPGFSEASDYQQSLSSRETDSTTTTSGSYNLTNDELSLSPTLSPTDSVFPNDLYV